MESIGVFEAKTHLSRLFERVAGGETIIITKYGNPIAKLVPFANDQSPCLRKVVKEIHKLRAGLPRISHSKVKKLIAEGRKY